MEAEQPVRSCRHVGKKDLAGFGVGNKKIVFMFMTSVDACRIGE